MRFLIFAISLVVAGGFSAAAPAQQKAPGAVFSDCQHCPAMVVISPGKFVMGEGGVSRETPTHPVTIGYSFAIARNDVTFEEWDACVADGGCGGYSPADGGWGRGNRPVINVSWNDAQSYAAWLSRKTGKHYRLVSEAEWEYVARAGSTTIFPWGDNIGVNNANCEYCGSQWGDKQTAPVGSFKPNAFGVYDMAGNVTQWVEDAWNASYVGAPQDGSAWQTGDSRRRVMRNGSWYNNPSFVHSAYRNADAPTVRNAKIGFRVALSL